MTKAERYGLLFLAAVVVLGVGARLWRTYCPAPATANSGAIRQIAIVDSARAAGASGRASGRGRARSSTGSARGQRGGQSRAPAGQEAEVAMPTPSSRLDLDIASVEQIESLPGVGALLARRIIADRGARHPFGCVLALETVQGVTRGVVGRIDSLITFSGVQRPICSQ